MNRETLCVLALGASLLATGCDKAKSGAAASPSPAAATPSEDDRAIYALGVAIGSQTAPSVEPLMLTPDEMETLKRGLADALAGKKPDASFGEAEAKRLQARVEANAPKLLAAAKQKGAEFSAKEAAEPGAAVSATGLVHRTLRAGQGPNPKATDAVRVHYEGTLIDGRMFDSSIRRGQPAEFRLDEVVPCWGEGVQKMKVGEKARLICPSDLAYGDRGQPPTIPPGATLVFEVELLGIQAKAAAARQPQAR